MQTIIKITPPNEPQHTVRSYDKVIVSQSTTNRTGTYSISMRGFDSSLIDKFPVGSDVQINQDGHLFRGWVLNPAKALDGIIREMSLEGSDYTSKTHKVMVTESFVEKRIDDIVRTLFTNYVPWATTLKIEENAKVITTKFADVFLFDAMEILCKISGFEWYIDQDLAVNFFSPGERINPNIMKVGSYKKGSCNLKPVADDLVNKLWVKGGKTLSDNFHQEITVINGVTPISLFYTPRATTEGVIVMIDGIQRTVGIQYLHEPGSFDFMLNFSEKLLIPDQCTSGAGTITYRYEYPIKFLLEDPDSQKKYGLFEGVYNVDTPDRNIALDLGLRYLDKYAHPVISGGIEPFDGIYNAGELVKVEIPELKIDEYLQIKTVTYSSTANTGRVERKLELETPERDAASVLKNHEQRLRNLEKQVYLNDEGPVERYIAPKVEEWGWSENVSQSIYACPTPSNNLFPSENLYPC